LTTIGLGTPRGPESLSPAAGPDPAPPAADRDRRTGRRWPVAAVVLLTGLTGLTAIATLEGGGSIGIGFAVPIDRARQVADGIIGRG
jgi:hypothetical protein